MGRFLLLFLILCSLASRAQVAGYMGKRFIVFVDGNPTPAVLVENSNNNYAVAPLENQYSAGISRFAFNFRPQLTFEYLAAPKMAVGVSYGLIRVGVPRAIGAPGNTQLHDFDPDVIKGQSIGLHFKFYKLKHSSSIPPIGLYETLSVYLTKSNSYDTKKSSMKIFKNDFVYPAITYSIGGQTPLAKNLLLKSGIEFGWTFVPTNFFSEGSSSWTAQQFSGYHVHKSLFAYYAFSINVAVGYIPF
jgi:hypothetical protein